MNLRLKGFASKPYVSQYGYVEFCRKQKAFPLRGRCQRKLTDEVEKNNDCFRNLHLTTAYGGASPQGEALNRLHLNLMCRNQ